MLSRLLRSPVVREISVRAHAWATMTSKPVSNLIRFGAVGTGTLFLLKGSFCIAHCDRLSHSRIKYEAEQHLLHHKGDDPTATNWSEFCSMLWSQKWYLIIAFGVSPASYSYRQSTASSIWFWKLFTSKSGFWVSNWFLFFSLFDLECFRDLGVESVTVLFVKTWKYSYQTLLSYYLTFSLQNPNLRYKESLFILCIR